MADAHVDPAILAALADSTTLGRLAPDEREALALYLVPRAFAPGDSVLAEGCADRSMYVIVSGAGTLCRGALELGSVHAGDCVGELALVLARPRAASVVAAGALLAAELTLGAFERLGAERPGLAQRVLATFLAGTADRLVAMTESVGLLLRERSLPGRRHARVRLAGGEVREVAVGTELGTLLPKAAGGSPVVAALVDGRAASLTAPIASDCTLAPLTTGHWEGQRVVRASHALGVIEAAACLDPPARLQIDHSLGYGQRVAVIDAGGRDLATLAAALEAGLAELRAANAPLREELWTMAEARAWFAQAGLAEVAALLATWRDAAVAVATYGRAYALALEPRLPSTDRFASAEVEVDRAGVVIVPDDGPRSRAARRRANSAAGPDPAPAPALEQDLSTAAALRTAGEQERWLRTLGVTSVGAFNALCIRGEVSQLIRVSEGFQEKRIGAIADAIAARAGAIRVICVAGPSSAGKTTFLKRLRVQLLVAGIRPLGISLDDYYVDREKTPRDPDGEYDFEALEALDLGLFHDHLDRLLAGLQVATARYDFQSGRSFPESGPLLRLGEREVLVLEGIHGLNPALFTRLEASAVFRVFISPLAQLPFDLASRVRASDVRLLRRIVRDRHGRGHDAGATILRWPSVRRGERRHIFPFQDRADATFDSSLIYELSVLKVFAERYLLEVPHGSPAHVTAFRLLRLLDGFVTLYPDHVPQTSILREFIGGSGFDA